MVKDDKTSYEILLILMWSFFWVTLKKSSVDGHLLLWYFFFGIRISSLKLTSSSSWQRPKPRRRLQPIDLKCHCKQSILSDKHKLSNLSVLVKQSDINWVEWGKELKANAAWINQRLQFKEFISNCHLKVSSLILN